MRTKRRRQLIGTVYVLPALLFVLAFTVYPLGQMIWMSLNSWSLITPPKYIGLDNYKQAFDDRQFWVSFLFTLKYTAIITPILIIGGYLLALLTATNTRLRRFTRGAVFIVNPNHESCTLYPEEIEQLLTTGRIGLVTQETIQEGQMVLAGTPRQTPDWLINGLAALYAKLPFVVAAYLLETVRPDISNETIWLVTLVVEPPYEDRAVHATSAALQEPWAEAFGVVDLTTVTPDRTEDLLEGAMKFYERDSSVKNTDIAPGIPRKMLKEQPSR